MAKPAEHPIVGEYITASDISEEYLDNLKAEIFNKGFVGKKTNEKNIDDVVNFLHSDEVAGMIKERIGNPAKDLSNEAVLARFGLPKHRIKEILKGYESITEGVLVQLVGTLSAQMHGELTSHHAAEIANYAVTHGDAAARGIVTELYRVSGGDKYAAANKKTIDTLVEPGKIHDHISVLYRDRVLQGEYVRHRETIRKPVKD